MNEDQIPRMTDLDAATGSRRMQMIKAALPYLNIPEQKFFSLAIKFTELERTIRLFDGEEDGQVGICSADKDSGSPIDMLNAMKTYGNEEEQDFIDVAVNFMQGARLYRSYRESAPEGDGAAPPRSPLEQLKAMLSPGQRDQLENMQMMMQMMQQFS